jgi:hypothetical protein
MADNTIKITMGDIWSYFEGSSVAALDAALDEASGAMDLDKTMTDYTIEIIVERGEPIIEEDAELLDSKFKPLDGPTQ